MDGQPQFNSGANQLTNTLKGMIGSIAGEKSKTQIDIGIIHSDYSLTTNSFPKPIPKNSYSVCRQLLYNPAVPLTETYVDGGHDHDSTVPFETHYHKVKLPPKMRWLKPGDKVLVAIVGNEFIVIDIIYNAQYLGKAEPSWR